jgi:pimeloyl-ACP methyl ester carboxylesterase
MRLDDVFIKLDHTTVYGKLAGEPSGRLVLGLHGWSQRNGWHTWEPLLAPLGEAGFCAVSVDMPGWGDSPAIGHLPLLGDAVVSVVIDIMNGLQKETAVLMGKSWGGGVALSTALAHPERVSHLILTAPAYRDTEKLAHLSQPVLLAWAKDDPVIPYSRAGELVAAIPDATLISYDSGGHSAAPKNAADFGPRAIEFLKD